jgi:hypothetical protein
MNRNPDRSGLALPVILITIGIVFLLVNLGIIETGFWNIITQLWPALFIIFGLDGLYRNDGLIGPLFSIVSGTILLLGTLGVLAIDILDIILRFWPVLIIVLGLDIILGWRRNQTLPKALLGIAAVIILLVGIFWLVTFQPTQGTQMIMISHPLVGVNNGSIEITAHAGNLLVHPLTDPDNLVLGSVQLLRSQNLDSDYSIQDGTASVIIQSQGTDRFPLPSTSPRSEWDIQVNQQIPLMLDITLLTGQSEIDLTDLTLESFTIATMVGNSQIVLPASMNGDGEISGAIGMMTVLVPNDAPVRFQIDRGITALQIPPEFTQDGDLVYSPAAQRSNQWMDIRLNQPIGRIVIQSIN